MVSLNLPLVIFSFSLLCYGSSAPTAEKKLSHQPQKFVIKRAISDVDFQARRNPSPIIPREAIPIGAIPREAINVPREILMRQYPGPQPQGRTVGLIDKLSEGLAQGISSGLSTGISSGIASGVYALPDAIAGTVSNLKNPYYVSQLGGGSIGGGSGHGSLLGGGGSYLSYGIPYGSFGKPQFSGSSFSLRPSYGASPLFYSPGLSNIHTGGSSIYSNVPNVFSGGNVYSGGALSYFNKKPIIGAGHNLAPSTPYHWDCKLVPAPTGGLKPLGGYKAAAEDEDQVNTLSQLIQETGLPNEEDARMAASEPIRWSSPRSNVLMDQQIHPTGFYRNDHHLIDQPMGIQIHPMGIHAMEMRKNMDLLEETNLNMPALGMIDSNKLVDPEDLESLGHFNQINPHEPLTPGQNIPPNANVVVFMIPITDMEQHQMNTNQYHQGSFPPQTPMQGDTRGHQQNPETTLAGNAQQQQTQHQNQQQQQILHQNQQQQQILNQNQQQSLHQNQQSHTKDQPIQSNVNKTQPDVKDTKQSEDRMKAAERENLIEENDEDLEARL